MTRTQVTIIGAGPSGLLLSQLLARNGIDSLVIERQTRAHVEGRIRAGILEQGTVDLVCAAGVGQRMLREGLAHDGFDLAVASRVLRIDLHGLTGERVLVYGQTELQKDLGDAVGDRVVWQAEGVTLDLRDGRAPRVNYRREGRQHEVVSDFIAGCDGFHGASRAAIPKDQLREYERVYPCGWLGVLADVPPLHQELVYVNHDRGFALCSMRSRHRSRYYVQCDIRDRVEDWPDTRFWDELERRLPAERAGKLVRGASIEKSIAPLRSFVAEPMRFGPLFLVGDAAHIVPPAGAKGLNLAAADVRVLFDGLAEHYGSGRDSLLDDYSRRALERVWKATRFSWWFTMLTHRLSDHPFDRRLQLAEFDYLAGSEAARRSMAENYVGLHFG